MREEEKDRRTRRSLPWFAAAALSGVLAGFASLAVAELVAAAGRAQAGPVIAVGGAAIDATPAPVKDWAIRHFGTAFTRIRRAGTDFYADPHLTRPGEINHHHGGRGVYFMDPAGHGMEIITRPYGSHQVPATS